MHATRSTPACMTHGGKPDAIPLAGVGSSAPKRNHTSAHRHMLGDRVEAQIDIRAGGRGIYHPLGSSTPWGLGGYLPTHLSPYCLDGVARPAAVGRHGQLRRLAAFGEAPSHIRAAPWPRGDEILPPSEDRLDPADRFLFWANRRRARRGPGWASPVCSDATGADRP